MQCNEELRTGDLRMLLTPVFEIDSYASKMGDDKDIVVLSFTVKSKEAALDLVNFVERGYDFVLDADASPGELDENKYKVFVEIERNRKISKQISEIIEGLEKLTGNESFKFRYYKSFVSVPATQEELEQAVPGTSSAYEMSIKENQMNNFSNFFNRSYLESIDVENNDITFQKKFNTELRMKIVDFGPLSEVYNRTPGRLMVEHSAVSEAMFITKYVGNYNINKVGDAYIFENENFGLVLKF